MRSGQTVLTDGADRRRDGDDGGDMLQETETKS